MSKYSSISSVIGIAATITLMLPNQALALERSEIAALAKQFTVRIDGEETGSGTIIEHNGNTYTVLTNWHVVDTPGQYQITTPDGRQHQVSYTEIKNLSGVDLAVIQFTSNESYTVAQLGNSETISEGTTVYLAGYPDPLPGIPQRSYNFQSAEVNSLLSTAEEGYEIIYNNPTTPGTSGGPVLDGDGRVIGVNGKYTADGNTGIAYGMGIPLQIYIAAQNQLSQPTEVSAPQDFVSVVAYYHRGSIYYDQKEYDKAIADYNEALSLDSQYQLSQPTEVSAPQDFVSVVAYYYRGSIYYDQKEYDKAIADYNADAYNNRGLVYHDQKEYDKALADYNEALRLNPQLAVSYYNRGFVYFDLQEYDKAIADYSEAIRLDPELVVAYYNRGIAYSLIGEKTKAIEDLRLAANLYKQQQNQYAYEQALKEIQNLE